MAIGESFEEDTLQLVRASSALLVAIKKGGVFSTRRVEEALEAVGPWFDCDDPVADGKVGRDGQP